MTSTIGFFFFDSKSDVPHPRHATSEPFEHTYGHMIQYKLEITILESMEIYKRLKIKQVSMYSSGFNGGRMRKKGCQSTQIDFLNINNQLC